jgi:hypothetical protein
MTEPVVRTDVSLASVVYRLMGTRAAQKDSEPQTIGVRAKQLRRVNLLLRRIPGAAAPIVGIEVKAAATVTSGDFKGLDDLAHSVGKRFHRGVVHAGDEAVRAGPSLHAVPISTLWRNRGERPHPRRRRWTGKLRQHHLRQARRLRAGRKRARRVSRGVCGAKGATSFQEQRR